jgi:hypothetical protein
MTTFSLFTVLNFHLACSFLNLPFSFLKLAYVWLRHTNNPMHSICRTLIATQTPELTQFHIKFLHHSSVPTSARVAWEYSSLQHTQVQGSNKTAT